MHISPFKFENLDSNPTGDQFTAMQFPMKALNGNVKEAAQVKAEAEQENVVEEVVEEITTYTEEELEAAKLQAFKKGFEDGKKEAQAAIDQEAQQLQQAIETMLQSIQEQLPSIHQKQQDLLQQKQEEIGKLVLHCSGRVTLEALRQNPLSDIEVMIGETLESLLGKYEVRANVHPRLINPLTERFGKEIRFKPDPTMTPGDCTLTWESGEAVRRIDDIWSEVEHVIDRYFIRHKSDVESDEDDIYLTPAPISHNDVSETANAESLSIVTGASKENNIEETPDGEASTTDTHEDPLGSINAKQ